MSTNTAQKFAFQNNSKLGVSEASLYLKITPSTLRRLENDGKIASERLSNGYRQYSFGDIVTLKNTLEERARAPRHGNGVEKPAIIVAKPTEKNYRYNGNIGRGASLTLPQIKSLKRLSYAGLALCLILTLGIGFRFGYGDGNGVIANIAKQSGIASLLSVAHISPNDDGISNNARLASVLGEQSGSKNYEFHVNIPAVFNESSEFKKGLTTTTANVAQMSGLSIIDGITENTLEKYLDLTGDAVSPAIGGLNNVVVNRIKGVPFGEIAPESGFVLMGNGDEWQGLSTEEIVSLGSVSTGTWEADPIEPGFLTGVWFTNGVTYTFPTAQATAVRQALVNDGSGTLAWTDLGEVNVADDALDFTDFMDAMTLDASTNIATAGYNLTISGSGKFGINGLLYSWPSAHTTSGVLQNNGSGTLSWVAIGADSLLDNSIDWIKLKNNMTLDATTTIDMVTNSADFGFGNGVLYIKNSGNIGIGTTNPSLALDVVGDIASTGDLSVNGGDLNTSSATFNVATTANTVNLAGGTASTGCTVDGTTGNLTCTGNIGGSSSGSVGFWKRAGTLVTTSYSGDTVSIDSYLGIGTTNPTKALSVVGDVGITGTVTGGLAVTGGLTVDTVNGNTITASSGALTLGAGRTLTVNDNATFNTTSMQLGNTKTLTLNDNLIVGTNSLTFAGAEMVSFTATKNLSFADEFNTSGSFPITLVATQSSNVTLPATGTLLTTTASANQAVTSTQLNGSVFSVVNAQTINSNLTGASISLSGDGTNTRTGLQLSVTGASSTNYDIAGTANAWKVYSSGQAYFAGPLAVGTTATPTFTIQSAGHVGPDADSLYNLGSNDVRWASIYGDNLYGAITPTGFVQGGVVFGGTGGVLSQDVTKFYINSTNGNVGIGTSAPQNRLDVAGSLAVGSYAGLYEASSNGMIISGNVGIGTTSPSYSLETAGDVYAGGHLRSAGDVYLAGTALSANTTATSGASKVGVYQGSPTMTYVNANTNVQSAIQTLDANLASVSSGANGIWARNSGTGVISPSTATDDLAIGGSTASAPFYVSDTGVISFSSDVNLYRLSANKLTTDDTLIISNNIGIGSTDPGVYLLAVGASNQFGVTSTGALTAYSINGNSITTDSGTLTLGGSTLTVSANTTLANASITLGNSKALTLNDSLTVGTNSLTFAGTETLSLTPAKNVSFADEFATSGAFPITLTATQSSNVTLPATGTLLTNTASANQTITSSQATGSLFTLLDATNISGSVIGQTITLSGTGAYDQTGLQFNLSGATGTNLYDIVGSGSTWKVSTLGTGYFVKQAIGYANVGTATLAINGNVGIGTTNPAYQLDVQGADGYVNAKTGLCINGSCQTSWSSGTQGYWTGYGNNISSNNSGNVGIGVTNPLQKLSVAGTFGFIEGGTSPQFYTVFQGGDQNADISYTWPATVAAGNDYVLTSTTGGGLEWKQVTAVGGAGDITAVGNITAGEAFTSGTPGSSLFFGDLGYLGIGASAGRIVFDDDTTDKIYILSGNVGIGNTAATAALSVGADEAFKVTDAGAVTAASYNGNTITASTGTLTLPAAKTVQFADAFYTSGIHSLTLTTTADTNVTLPITGTLLTNTASANQTVTSSQASGTVLGLTDTTNITSAIKALDITLSGTGVYDQTGLQFNLSGATGANLYDMIGSGSTWKVSTAGTGYFTKSFISGNVGIGTTNPTYNLDVTGTARITSTTNLPSITASRLLATDASSNISATTAYGWIAGTASQVTVTDDGDGTVTLSLPQAIASTSSPTFVGLTLSGLPANGAVISSSGVLSSEAQLDETRGGTGLGTYTTGDMIYASNTDVLSNLAIGTAGKVMLSNGTAPSWGLITAAGITADSLDYSEFKDALTLDAATSTNFYNAALTASYNMRFYDSNQSKEILYLDSAGKVGIGNTAPSVAFSVGASEPFKVTDAGAVTALTVNGNTITTGSGTLTLGAGKTLTVNATTTFATSSGNDYITFGGTERLTLASLKDVTFAEAFSTTSTGPITLAAAGAGGSSVVVPTSGTLLTNTASANQTITSTQNSGSIFGITGATNPAAALTAQAISLTGGSTSYAQTGVDITINGQGTTSGLLKGLAFAVSGGTSTMYDIYGTSGTWYVTNAGVLGFSGDGILKLGDAAGTYAFRLKDSGDASIFTVDSLGNLTLDGKTASSAVFNLTPTGATDVFTINRGGSGTGFAFRVNDGGTGDLSPFVINSGGNVGIGTTAPVNKLDVFGGMAIGSYAGVNTAPSNGLIISGNVGIGTTGPGAKLHVYGAAADLRVEATSGTGRIQVDAVAAAQADFMWSKAGSTKWLAYVPASSGDLRFYDATATAGDRVTFQAGGNVGIGTTGPSGLLDVNGNSRFRDYISLDSGVEILSNMYYSSGYKYRATGAAFSIEPTAAGYLSFITAPSGTAGNAVTRTERLRLSNLGGLSLGNGYVGTDAGAGNMIIEGKLGVGYSTLGTAALAINGNVGIGTTGPGYKLVLGSADSTGMVIGFNSSGIGSGAEAVGTIYGGYTSSASWANSYLRFTSHVGNVQSLTDTMTIMNGNVGIGTTNPVTLLSVMKADGSGTPSILVGNDATGTASKYGEFYYSDTGDFVGISGGWTGHTRDIVLQENGGNVGIGTTAPGDKLDVNGGISVGGSIQNRAGVTTLNLYPLNGGSAGGMSLTSGGVTTFLNNAGTAQVTLNNGNVGIGTTSPGTKLEIGGNNVPIYFSGVTAANRLVANNSGNYYMGLSVYNSGTTSKLGLGYSSAPTTTVTDVLTIQSDGNVGIGTVAPRQKLDVSTTSTTGVNLNLQISGNDYLSGKAYGIAFAPEGVSYTFVKSALVVEGINTGYNRGNIHFLQNSVGDTSGATLANAVMTIANSGNVGIGTTAPGSRLSVSGGGLALGSTYATFVAGDGNAIISGNVGIGTTAPGSRLSVSGGGLALGSTYATFVAGDGNAIIAGNVGIGTTGPETLLHLQSANPTIMLSDSDFAGNAVRATINSNNGSLILNSDVGSNSGSSYIGFVSDLTEVMRITNAGNVGIGTTTPGAKLEVNKVVVTYVASEIGLLVGGTASDPSTFILGNTINFQYGQNSDTGGGVNYRGYNSGVTQFRDFIVWDGKGTAIATFDGSTGGVGIGTTGPGAKLQIEDTSVAIGSAILKLSTGATDTTSAIQFAPASTKYNWAVGAQLNLDQGFSITPSTATGGSTFSTAALTIVGSSGNVSVGYADPGTAKLAINGNVGIGTTSPAGTLNVAGSTLSYFDRYSDNTSGAGIDVRKYRGTMASPLTVQNGDEVGKMLWGAYDGTSMLQLGGIIASVNGTVATNSIPTNLVFQTSLTNSAVERMRISPTGGLSVGTNVWNGTDPGAGNVAIQGNVGIGTTSPGAKLSVSGGLGIGSTYATTAVSDGNMIISGNVGIGTTGPQTKLMVSGDFDGASALPTLDGNKGLTIVKSTGVVSDWGVGDLYGLTFSAQSNNAFVYPVAGVYAEPTAVSTGVGGNLRFMTHDQTTGTLIDRMAITAAGNVGIGTTGPTAKLHIADTYSNKSLAFEQSSGYVNYKNFAFYGSLDTGASRNVLNLGAYSDVWGLSNTIVSFNHNGNVGIGTTGPLGKLSVIGGGVAGATTYLGGTVDDGVMVGYVPSTGLAEIIAVNHAFATYNDLGIRAGNGTQLYLKTDGNVGIGTTGPGGILDVRGATSLFGSGQGYTYIYEDSLNFRYDVDANSIGYINHRGYNGGLTQFRDTQISDGKGNPVAFFDGSTGNVGIGTTGPARKLEITTPTGTHYQLRLGDGTSIYDVGRNTTDGLMYFYGNQAGYDGYVFSGVGGEKVRITTAGNVGIGTTGPTEKLQVAGNVLIANDSKYNINDDSWGISKSGAQMRMKMSYSGSSSMVFGRTSAGEASDFTGLVTILDSGNIGIGTTGPATTLNIAEPAGTGQTYANGLLLSESGQGALYGLSLWYNGASNTNTYIEDRFDSVNSSMNFRMRANGTPVSVMTLKGSGNVGIGTADPKSKLWVRGVSGGNVAGFTTDDWTTTVGTMVQIGVGAGTGNTYGTVNSYQNGWGTWGNLALQSGGGNVGIGTTGPGYKLDVSGTGRFTDNLLVPYGSPTATSLQIGEAAYGLSSTNNILYVRASQGFDFRNNADQTYMSMQSGGNVWLGGTAALTAPTMAIQASGNVGIGTTGPQTKLMVSGDFDGASALPTLDGNKGLTIVKSTGVVSDWGVGDLYGLTFSAQSNNAFVYPVAGVYAEPTAVSTGVGGNLRFMTHDQTTGTLIDRMAITAAGNVGIGTTAPGAMRDATATAKLQIYNSSGSVYTSLASAVTNAEAMYSVENLNRQYRFGIGTDNVWLLYDDTANTTRFSIDTSGNFNINSGQLYVQQSSGNVGIGTTAPVNKLHVYGVDGLPASSGTVVTTGNMRLDNASAIVLDFGTNNVSPYPAWIQAHDRTNQAANYPISLNPNGGNVGIGTTGPGATLEVSGGSSGGATPVARFRNLTPRYDGTPTKIVDISTYNTWNSGQILIYDHAGVTGVQLRGDNSENNYILGNVGIGTTAPVNKLDVFGGMAIGSYAGVNTAPSNGLIISGNVGIGTTNPGYKLDVVGDVNVTGGYRINGSLIGAASAGTITGQTLYWNGSAWTPTLTIFNNASGNVGIGTTGPSYRLDVQNGIADAVVQIKNTTSGGNGLKIQLAGDAYSALDIMNSAGTANNVRFYGNGNAYMAGNVGIGTTGPGELLTVGNGNVGATDRRTISLGGGGFADPGAWNTASNGDKLILINNATNIDARMGVGDNGIWFKKIGNATDKIASFWGSNSNSGSATELMVIKDNGNVGIGTTNPLQKLHVIGEARISGLASANYYVCVDANGDLFESATACAGSDIALKENIQPITNALTGVLSLSPVSFDWIDRQGRGSAREVGFIAQEMEKIFPQVVRTNPDGYKGIKYDVFSAVLTKAIQEQELTIKGLATQVQNLTTLPTAPQNEPTSEIAFLFTREMYQSTSDNLISLGLKLGDLEIAKSAESARIDLLQSDLDSVKAQITLLTASSPESSQSSESSVGASTPSTILMGIENIYAEFKSTLEALGIVKGEDGGLILQNSLAVLGEATLTNLNVTGKLTMGLLQIDGMQKNGDTREASIGTVSGDLYIMPKSSGEIAFMSEKIVMDKKGNLKVNEGVIMGNKSFRDAVKLTAGETVIDVADKQWEDTPKSVVVTPSYNTKVWVEQISATGFEIHADSASEKEETLYWIAIW